MIDEVDSFSRNEKALNLIIKALINRGGVSTGNGVKKNSLTSTCVIGIANSVDLTFRKKDGALSQRDEQILFKPYDETDIEEIINEKMNECRIT